MIVGASWMEDQRRAALHHTASLARRIAGASGAVLIAGPQGPWSAATLASVHQGAPRRRVCPHLAHGTFSVIPIGPRPLVAPSTGVLTCVHCAAAEVRAAGRPTCCAGCPRTRPLGAVVAHGAVLVMLGRLCPRCLSVEIHGTPSIGRLT